MSKNDVTGDRLISKVSNDAFRKGHARIFGQKDTRAICYWPDGTWCDRSEVAEYTHMSDDYTTIHLSYELGNSDVERIVSDAINGG